MTERGFLYCVTPSSLFILDKSKLQSYFSAVSFSLYIMEHLVLELFMLDRNRVIYILSAR